MASLGDTLRERRIALGLTLDQAESATRIRARLLEALEEGAYDRLPAPGYVRGYISSYGRFLELDPQPLLQLYKAETGERRSSALNLPQIDEAVPRTGEQHAISPAAALMAATAVAVAALIVWAIATWSARPDATQPEPVPVTGVTATAVPPKDDAAADSGETSGRTTVGDPQTNSLRRPFEVTVRVSDTKASWVRVIIDGRRAYEGTLTGGQSKTFQVVGEASIRIGEPAAVTILRDGRPVTIPEGDPPTVRLVAETP